MSQSEEDEAKLLETFPPEVWTMVLKNLIDPVDLTSCCAASPIFKEILEPRKVLYLYPQVLKILGENSYLDNNPPLMRSCRQVCRTWSLATNKFLEIRPYHFKPSLNDYSHRGFPTEASSDPAFGTFFRLNSQTHTNLIELEQQIVPELSLPFYREHNPFPSRHLELLEPAWCSEVIVQRYRTATMQILANVGHHVWHVRIRIVNRPISSWYTLWRNYVLLMPNLKSLYMYQMPVSVELRAQPDEMMMRHTRTYCDSIATQADLLPFPTLPNLMLLSLQELTDTAVEAILTSNLHVQALEIIPSRMIHWQNPDFWDYHRSVARVFKNLTSLSLSLVRLEDLTRIRNYWKLESLRLECTMLPNPIVHWAAIWEKVERYSKTLTELTVNMLFEDFAEPVGLCVTITLTPVKLPNVKKLWISLPDDCSIDFLLGLKSLEFLSLRMSQTIRVDHDDVYLPGVITPKVASAQDILKCNIWEKIPTLKVVEWWEEGGRFRKYKREQVEEYQATRAL